MDLHTGTMAFAITVTVMVVASVEVMAGMDALAMGLATIAIVRFMTGGFRAWCGQYTAITTLATVARESVLISAYEINLARAYWQGLKC